MWRVSDPDRRRAPVAKSCASAVSSVRPKSSETGVELEHQPRGCAGSSQQIRVCPGRNKTTIKLLEVETTLRLVYISVEWPCWSGTSDEHLL